jgi:hypothetical protein
VVVFTTMSVQGRVLRGEQALKGNAARYEAAVRDRSVKSTTYPLKEARLVPYPKAEAPRNFKGPA